MLNAEAGPASSFTTYHSTLRFDYALLGGSGSARVSTCENRVPTMPVTLAMRSVTSCHSCGRRSCFSWGWIAHWASTCVPFRLTSTRSNSTSLLCDSAPAAGGEFPFDCPDGGVERAIQQSSFPFVREEYTPSAFRLYICQKALVASPTRFCERAGTLPYEGVVPFWSTSSMA